jgi:MTH538 TIR-like domain (DUF1863)
MAHMPAVFVSMRQTEQPDLAIVEAELGERWELLTHAVSPAAEATWRDECRRLIGTADAVVCIVGDETAESPNVDWELEIALSASVPVVAMRSPRARDPRLPAPLAVTGHPLVDPEAVAQRLEALVYERAR